MSDKFESYAGNLASPPSSGFAIAPSDTTDLAFSTRCINVATSGSVTVTLVGGDTVQYFVAAGAQFPCRAKRVFATGTDATGLVGSY
ncbi:MAG: hypothetical protein ABJL99_10200 [Aliishimia sp.]